MMDKLFKDIGCFGDPKVFHYIMKYLPRIIVLYQKIKPELSSLIKDISTDIKKEQEKNKKKTKTTQKRTKKAKKSD